MYDFQTSDPAPDPAWAKKQSTFQRVRSLVKLPANIPRNRRTALGIGVGSLLVVSLAAASLGGPGPSLAKKATNLIIGGESVDLDHMPHKLAEMYCSALLECNSESEIAARFEGVEAKSACIAANTIRLREETLAGMNEAQKRGVFHYNAAFASQCIERLSEKKCDVLGYSLFEICTDTFVGKSEGSCLHEYECGPKERCELSQQCPGSCVPKSELSQPCRMAQDCSGGLFCSDLTFTCEPIKQKGESCAKDESPGQCAEGLYCDDGKCTPNEVSYSKDAGDWCGDEGMCKSGMSCTVSFTHNECLPIAQGGQPCRAGVPSHCVAGHFCTADPESGKWEGVCEPKLQEGSTCNAAEQCDPTLECVNGGCKKLSGVGQSCSGDEECFSTNCEDGRCQPANPCGEK